jgi:hypothetical protein
MSATEGSDDMDDETGTMRSAVKLRRHMAEIG